MPLRAQRLSGPGPDRVLVVAPHPDDELHSAATWLQHLALGARVTVVVLTDGSASRRIPGSRDDVRRLRREEAEAAQAILSATRWEWAGRQDGALRPQAAAETLFALVETEAPELIYAPSFADGHPDHLASTLGLAHCLVERAEVPVRLYPVQTPLTPILTNLAVDGGRQRERVVQAVRAHRSQSATFAPILRAKTYAASLYGGDGWVDEYWEVPSSALQAIGAVATPFAYPGLRERAFLDPAAYLSGWGQRRSLLNAASSRARSNWRAAAAKP